MKRFLVIAFIIGFIGFYVLAHAVLIDFNEGLDPIRVAIFHRWEFLLPPSPPIPYLIIKKNSSADSAPSAETDRRSPAASYADRRGAIRIVRYHTRRNHVAYVLHRKKAIAKAKLLKRKMTL